MNDDHDSTSTRGLTDYLQRRVSRAQLLAATGAGVLLAAAPKGTSAQATSAPESVQTIINTAITAEHLAVTLLTGALASAPLNLSSNQLLFSTVQAALAEEQYHADFLAANGATPLTDVFTVPDPAILTNVNTFLRTVEAAETLFIGAYMAAVREFTVLNQPQLAKYAYQIGGVEAEHRAMARAGLALTGDSSGVPPNNKAFESNVVSTVGDAGQQLVSLGFINGSGTKVAYPGRAAALQAALPFGARVLNTTPNNSTPIPLAASLPGGGGRVLEFEA